MTIRCFPIEKFEKSFIFRVLCFDFSLDCYVLKTIPIHHKLNRQVSVMCNQILSPYILMLGSLLNNGCNLM